MFKRVKDTISTHSAHEDGDILSSVAATVDVISTHSAHEDGDMYESNKPIALRISTHSAHEDGDKTHVLERRYPKNFNPLRPRGRRQTSHP